MNDCSQLREDICEVIARLDDILNRIEADMSIEDRRVLLDSLSPLNISTINRLLSLKNQIENLELAEGSHPNTDSCLRSDIENLSNNTATSFQSNTLSRKNHAQPSKKRGSSKQQSIKFGASGPGAKKFSNYQLSISQKLCENLAQCANRPEFFWEKIGKSPASMRAGLKSAFFEIYYEQGDAELLEIYRRFKLRNFFLLAVDLDYHTGERWCRKASTELARELAQKQPSLEAKEADLKRCLDDYVRLGRKYDRWATELGGQGYLIALPLDITEREYTDRHFSESFPLAIRKLREGGIDRIVNEHGYDKLGDHISEQLRTQSWPSEPARRHLTKSARRNKRKREAKRDETMRSKKGPGAPSSPKRTRRHEVNCTRPIEFENVCPPEEETPQETNENSRTNSSLSQSRPGSTVYSPTSCGNVEHSRDVCEHRSSCSLTPQESACEHPLTQEGFSSSSETAYSKDEPSNISYGHVEDPTESPISLLDQPPLDPFLSSDFPHNIFDNSHDLLNDLVDLPSLDPFLASDFPHGHIDDPVVPPVDLLDRPSLDPFLASDFPHGHYVGPPALSVDFSDRPALDPFPASNFSHGYVGNPPALQIDLLDREALDPFPESDFPHRSIKYPTELAHQYFISTSSNRFSPEQPSSSGPIGPGNCQPKPPGNNSLVCGSNARPIDDPYTCTWDGFRRYRDLLENSPNCQTMNSDNIQSEAHKGTNCGPTPMVPVQF